MTTSEGNPLTKFLDMGAVHGRLIVDGGFTRLID